MILEFIRPQLVQQTDSAAFLMLIDDEPPAFSRDFTQRNLQLRTAVASKTVEYIARKTL